jgi:DNA-binding IclR family transcriptional regulator
MNPAEFWERLARAETNPWRTGIIEALAEKGERMSARELAAAAGQPKAHVHVNYHLGVLEAAGIVAFDSVETDGPEVHRFYTLIGSPASAA